MVQKTGFYVLILVLAMFFCIPVVSAVCDLTGTWEIKHLNWPGKWVVTQSGSTVHIEMTMSAAPKDSVQWANDGKSVENGILSGNTLKFDGTLDYTISDDCTSFKAIDPTGYYSAPVSTGTKTSGSTGVTSAVTPKVTTAKTTTTTATSGTGATGTLEFTNMNLGAVYNNPTVPTFVTFSTPVQIISITNYHWNDRKGDSPTGTIALKDQDGTIYGWWSTTGSPGMGGVPNAYWTASPSSVTVKAGKYTILDSNPSTWSKNLESGHAGHTKIKYLPVSSSAGAASGTTTAAITTKVTTAKTTTTTAPSGSGTASGIVGAWSFSNGATIYFHPDGTLEGWVNGVKSGTGTWTLLDPWKRIYNIFVGAGSISMTLSENGNSLDGYNSENIRSTASRISGSDTPPSGTGSTGTANPGGRAGGKATALDALIALKISVEKMPFDANYDVSNDGKVNSNDAKQILVVAAGY